MPRWWWDDDAHTGARRSIWDDPEVVDRPSQIEPGIAASDHPTHGAAGWVEAEAALAGPLAEAAQALARVDERLRAWSPAHRRAGAERLAMAQAAALLWAEGASIGIERLGLDAVERFGRTDQEDHEIARAVDRPMAAS